MNMNSQLLTGLEQCLPDAIVIRDMKRVIHEEAGSYVELDAGSISIPVDCAHEVISKAFIEQRFDVGFGNCFRAVVAVGGVSSIDCGLIQAKYCVCTLWYNSGGNLITLDFSKETA